MRLWVQCLLLPHRPVREQQGQHLWVRHAVGRQAVVRFKQPHRVRGVLAILVIVFVCAEIAQLEESPFHVEHFLPAAADGQLSVG